MAPLTPGRRGVDGLLLGAFYLFELCALILAFDLPRLSGRSLRSAIGSAVGVFAILGLLGIVISVLLIVRQHLRARRECVRRFGLTLAINILPLALVISARGAPRMGDAGPELRRLRLRYRPGVSALHAGRAAVACARGHPGGVPGRSRADDEPVPVHLLARLGVAVRQAAVHPEGRRAIPDQRSGAEHGVPSRHELGQSAALRGLRHGLPRVGMAVAPPPPLSAHSDRALPLSGPPHPPPPNLSRGPPGPERGADPRLRPPRSRRRIHPPRPLHAGAERLSPIGPGPEESTGRHPRSPPPGGRRIYRPDALRRGAPGGRAVRPGKAALFPTYQRRHRELPEGAGLESSLICEIVVTRLRPADSRAHSRRERAGRRHHPRLQRRKLS